MTTINRRSMLVGAGAIGAGLVLPTVSAPPAADAPIYDLPRVPCKLVLTGYDAKQRTRTFALVRLDGRPWVERTPTQPSP